MDQPEGQAPEPVVTEQPASKRRLKVWVWVMLVIILLGGGGTAYAWKAGYIHRVVTHYTTATVTFRLRDTEKYALEGATLTFRGTDYTTDVAGSVAVTAVAGTFQVDVKKTGYTELAQSVTLKRGDNGTLDLTMSKVPEKLYSVKGITVDDVSGLPVAAAAISLADTNTKADAAGGFTVDNVPAGTYDLKVTAAGYRAFTKSIVVGEVMQTDSYHLTPLGRVMFVSNRDGGKRAIYLSDYDGQNQSQLVTPVVGTEDYAPIRSPDGKHIVFSSTRDKVSGNYSGQYLPRLYVVDADGKNLKKLSDDVDPSKVVWSPDSAFIYYEAYADVAETTFTQRFYGIVKGKTYDLGESASSTAFANTSDAFVYLVSHTDAGDTQYDIKIKHPDFSDARVLGTNVGYVTSNLTFPADDSFVQFETQGTDGRHRYKIDIKTATQSEIPLTNEEKRTYIGSPDGTRKAYIDTRDGKTDLFTISADGTDERRLTTIGVVSKAAPVTWDTTGHYLTFAVVREGESAMYIVSSSGGDIKKIVDFSVDSQPIPYY